VNKRKKKKLRWGKRGVEACLKREERGPTYQLKRGVNLELGISEEH